MGDNIIHIDFFINVFVCMHLYDKSIQILKKYPTLFLLPPQTCSNGKSYFISIYFLNTKLNFVLKIIANILSYLLKKHY